MSGRFQALGWLRWGSGAALRSAKLPLLSARCSTLVGRAQLANLLSQRSARPSDPPPFPGSDAVACELSRQAIYWALLALRELDHKAPESAAEVAATPTDANALLQLWSEAAPDTLARAAGGPEEAQRLRGELLEKSFADFAELSFDRQASAAERLHAFAERLIEPLAHPQRAQELVWVRRFQLLLAGLVVLIGLGFVFRALKERHDLTLDLAPTASFKTSSQFDDCLCPSPSQSCDACPNYFFHTKEESHPYVVFDLQRVQSLSAVVVENRRDGYTERALPLLVQVSSDQKHWKTVATRKDDFSTWRADFSTQQTRWVKLSVARRDFFHLARVRLIP